MCHFFFSSFFINVARGGALGKGGTLAVADSQQEQTDPEEKESILE